MNDSLGEAGEGHLKEVHHIVGLLLLLLISCQVAINTKFAGRKQHNFGIVSKLLGGSSYFPWEYTNVEVDWDCLHNVTTQWTMEKYTYLSF